ncbi:MAG: SMP-30/gluconolactonase/LRE family protein [Myxococcota bacterium]
MRTRSFVLIACLGASSLGCACRGVTNTGIATDRDTDTDTDADADTDADPCAPTVDPGGDVDPLAGDLTVTQAATGFVFVEGPVWSCTDQTLLFTDIPANKILALDADDTVTEFRADSGKANGLFFDPDGLLLAAEHFNRRVSRTLADGTIETVADAWQGKKLNAPNDVVTRQDGTLWFTDPPYGLEGRPQELDFVGLFRVDTSDTLHVEYQGPLSERPNGVVLSPDSKTLYLADTKKGDVVAFDVGTDGALSDPRVFTNQVAGADGMTVDVQGNLYVTATAGVVVFAPDGTLRGTIVVPEQPANTAFGGPDGRTLYMTARTSVYRVRLGLPGL